MILKANGTAAHVDDLDRDERQERVAQWATLAFGEVEANSLPQRGLRLLEEAIEAFQACGGHEAVAQKLVTYVFARPCGEIGQELGGVAVTVLALAAAARISADNEECREIDRVLNKPLEELRGRNAAKNAAGFRAVEPLEMIAYHKSPVLMEGDREQGSMYRAAAGEIIDERFPRHKTPCPWAGCENPSTCDGTKHT